MVYQSLWYLYERPANQSTIRAVTLDRGKSDNSALHCYCEKTEISVTEGWVICSDSLFILPWQLLQKLSNVCAKDVILTSNTVVTSIRTSQSKNLQLMWLNHANSSLSDSHLVAAVNEYLGGNKFKDHKTVVTRQPTKTEEGRLSTQSRQAHLKIR